MNYHRFLPKERPFYDWDYNLFEAFIYEVFGMEDWSFSADQDAYNGGNYIFTVRKNPTFGDTAWERRKFENFLKNEGTGHTQTVLTFLCNQDVIPEGQYIISVYY